MNTTDQGRAAEDRAREFLESKRYVFLDANYRTKLGELDLVMDDRGVLVFVEVRERTNEAFGRGFETVTWSKQLKLAKAAMAYIQSKGLARRSMRFDIVSIGPRGVEHIPNAFVPAAGRYTI
jgi:putative endonuclease